jgi:hypothetical protein
MITFYNNNKNIKNSVLQKSTFILIKKRFMHRVIAAAHSLGNKMVRPIVSNMGNTRNYPGKGYTGLDYKKEPENNVSKNLSEIRTSTGTGIPEHEETHTKILDNETKLTVGLLSSCKNKIKGFHKIADENFKGQKVNSNANAANKSQWMRTFDNPRHIESDSMLENPQATAFLNKYEKTVDNIVSASNVNKKIPVKRLHKDDSALYHENGQPIYDKNGNEIDY